jgi:hypothetical protein
MGRKEAFGRLVGLGLMGLGCRPVRDFSDSFRRLIRGNSGTQQPTPPGTSKVLIIVSDHALEKPQLEYKS